ncbi:hypothetical protein KU306_17435 (plasmid) [Haloferax larsenii]|uniref:PIN domain-containing protein n=1 Tax=Haloferax larsenii TaxID=302484 RepID=A0ABY5RLJ8_HALLR|nr:hypothetical protein KU306_17435 [Haloferax larsenii]
MDVSDNRHYLSEWGGDWLGDAAETVYRDHQDKSATYVEDHEFTPFDALHLVESGGDTIVSSDETYESFAPRLDLKAVRDE